MRLELVMTSFYMIWHLSDLLFFSLGFLGCLIMLMTEKLYMPGSHSHTGLYTQTVQPILLFITSSVVSYLELKFNV